jgi:hypothetical protein
MHDFEVSLANGGKYRPSETAHPSVACQRIADLKIALNEWERNVAVSQRSKQLEDIARTRFFSVPFFGCFPGLSWGPDGGEDT